MKDRFSRLLLAGFVVSLMACAPALAQFPAYGADTGPGIILTANPDGSITGVATGQGPYDGVEDTYVGFVNNSPLPVFAFGLSSSVGAQIYGFDGDGIDTYGSPGNGSDGTGYGGPQTFFTPISGSSGIVNFIGGVDPGNTTYFSLEDLPTFDTLTVSSVPEPSRIASLTGLCAIGLLGFVWQRRRKAA